VPSVTSGRVSRQRHPDISDAITVTSANGYLGYKNGDTDWFSVRHWFDVVPNSGQLSVVTEVQARSISPVVVRSAVVLVALSAVAPARWNGDSRWPRFDVTSSSLIVGNSGSGILNITNGGQVSNSSSGVLGGSAGATGTVTIDGTGSTWTSSSLTVGNSGSGILNITNGGQVSNSSSGIVGSSVGASGTVTVNGAGSTWTCNGLNIGSSGSGVLTITNGGAVYSNSDCYLGYCLLRQER